MYLFCANKKNYFRLGNFLFDAFSMLIPSLCCVLFVYLFESKLFLEEALFATFSVCFMYGMAIIPFTYLFSIPFQSPSTAQGLMLLIYLSAAVIMMVAAWVMDFIDDENIRNTNQILKIVYRFFPSFLMGKFTHLKN